MVSLDLSNEKNSTIVFATISPISGTDINSSKDAFSIFFKVLNFFDRSLAVFLPTLGIPSPYINEDNSHSLLFSNAVKRFVAFLSPNFSNPTNSSFFILYKSAMDFIPSFSNNCSAVFSLNPAIFIASLPA